MGGWRGAQHRSASGKCQSAFYGSCHPVCSRALCGCLRATLAELRGCDRDLPHTLGSVSWPGKPKLPALWRLTEGCQGCCSPSPAPSPAVPPAPSVPATDLFALPPVCQPRGLWCSCALCLVCPSSQLFHFLQVRAQISASQWGPPGSVMGLPSAPTGLLVLFLVFRAVTASAVLLITVFVSSLSSSAACLPPRTGVCVSLGLELWTPQFVVLRSHLSSDSVEQILCNLGASGRRCVS